MASVHPRRVRPAKQLVAAAQHSTAVTRAPSAPFLPLHPARGSSEAGPEEGMARRAAAAAAARLLRRLGPLAAEPPARGDLVWFGLIWGPRRVRCWLVGSGGVRVCA